MRCRDGRLQYPGLLSFLLIALPMSIILVNQAIGEAIVSAAIPALYSAVLAFGAFLYSISLAALLLIFCPAVAAAIYWKLVYHPASVAHSRRKDKLRRLQYEGHSASKLNRLRRSEFIKSMNLSMSTSKQSSGYCRRSFNVMKHSIQHGVTLLSFRRTQRGKELAITKKWCGMNRPPLSQGAIGSGEVSPSQMSPDSGASRITEVRSMHRVPEKVMSMLAAASTQQLVEEKQRRFSFESSRTSSLSHPTECVVTTASRTNPRRAVTPNSLFTSEGAISHLRSRLSETFGRGIAGSMYVTESSLFDEFRLMLDIFYPDGVALSPSEKAEAFDQYNVWKDSANNHFTITLDEATALEVRMIPFGIFEEWFSTDILSILKSNLPDRLLDNSLRHVPNMKKRLTQLDATTLRPDSRVHMKSLTVVTPQHLVDPTYAESTLI